MKLCNGKIFALSMRMMSLTKIKTYSIGYMAFTLIQS